MLKGRRILSSLTHYSLLVTQYPSWWPSPSHQLLQPIHQHVRVHRLAEEVGRADMREGLDRFHRRVAAHDDDRDVVAEGVAELVRQHEAIDVRQVDVEDGGERRGGAAMVEGVGAAV